MYHNNERSVTAKTIWLIRQENDIEDAFANANKPSMMNNDFDR